MTNVKTVLCILFVINSLTVFGYSEFQRRLNNDNNEIIKHLILNNNELHSKVASLEQSIAQYDRMIPEHFKKNYKIKIVIDLLSKENNKKLFKSEKEFVEYCVAVVEFSEKFNIPISLSLAVSKSESNFNPRAISSASAKGIMQIMPQTFELCNIVLFIKYQHSLFVFHCIHRSVRKRTILVVHKDSIADHPGSPFVAIRKRLNVRYQNQGQQSLTHNIGLVID